jgi:hypothetical protein
MDLQPSEERFALGWRLEAGPSAVGGALRFKLEAGKDRGRRSEVRGQRD